MMTLPVHFFFLLFYGWKNLNKHFFSPLTIFIHEGQRDGSVLENMYFFCREFEFGSQYPCWEAQEYLEREPPRILWSLQALRESGLHPQHTHIILKLNLKNVRFCCVAVLPFGKIQSPLLLPAEESADNSQGSTLKQ